MHILSSSQLLSLEHGNSIKMERFFGRQPQRASCNNRTRSFFPEIAKFENEIHRNVWQSGVLLAKIIKVTTFEILVPAHTSFNSKSDAKNKFSMGNIKQIKGKVTDNVYE